MSALLAGFGRAVTCWVLFVLGVAALQRLGIGAVIVSGVGAVAINRVWRRQQLERLRRRHREAVIADEEPRIAVQESQQKPEAPTGG